MKILFLALRSPYPAWGGDRARNYHFISQLSQRHAVTLVYFAESEMDIDAVKHLQLYCEEVHWVRFRTPLAMLNSSIHCLSSTPLQVRYWYRPQMRRVIDRLLQKQHFDLIHANLFRMGQYVAGVRDVPKALDLTDSLALNLSRRLELDNSFSRFLVKMEERRVRRHEIEIMKRFDCGLVSTRFDRDHLLERNGQMDLHIIPGGVDLEYFTPYAQGKPPLQNAQSPEEGGGLNLLFTGNMSTFPNADAVCYFCRDILPLIKRDFPQVALHIVGTSPTRQVRRLQKREGVHVTGYVPDIRPYYENASAFITPMRTGSGMQTKNLEAMAMGLPVVSSSLGVKGLDASKGEGLLIGDDPETFAKHVVGLLQDSELRRTLAQDGRKWVEQHYGWQSIGERLEHAYSQIT